MLRAPSFLPPFTKSVRPVQKAVDTNPTRKIAFTPGGMPGEKGHTHTPGPSSWQRRVEKEIRDAMTCIFNRHQQKNSPFAPFAYMARSQQKGAGLSSWSSVRERLGIRGFLVVEKLKRLLKYHHKAQSACARDNLTLSCSLVFHCFRDAFPVNIRSDVHSSSIERK